MSIIAVGCLHNPKAKKAEGFLIHVQVLYRPADLRLGDRPGDHARRRAVHSQVAGQSVPEHRRACGRHFRQLPGRLGADGAGHRGAGHRAAAQRHRRAALHLLGEQLRRQHDHYRDLRSGHQPRYRPGSGAEQAAAGDAAAAAGGSAAGYSRHQGGTQLPDRDRLGFHRRQSRPA